MLALAGAQHVDEVYDESNQPHGANKHAIFAKKQRFVYAIFMTILQTSTGQGLVQKYENAYNAPKIFSLLAKDAKSQWQQRSHQQTS